MSRKKNRGRKRNALAERLGVHSLDRHMGLPLGERATRELPGMERGDPAEGYEWRSPALERLYGRLTSCSR